MSRAGPVTRELRRVKNFPLRRLYYFNARTGRYGCLSPAAKIVLHGACESVTGMDVSPNEYWLPEVMSEAIEAAEALGL